MRFRKTFRRVERFFDLRHDRYVIVRQIHPIIKANGGYYAIHPQKVWVWVKDKDRATTFSSAEQANMAAVGSNIKYESDYQIERV